MERAPRVAVIAAVAVALAALTWLFRTPILEYAQDGVRGEPVLDRGRGHMPPDEAVLLDIPVPSDDVQILYGWWREEPLLVVLVPMAYIDGVTAARGAEAPLPRFVEHPASPDHAVFAYSATSTFLGCTVGWNEDLAASKDVADYNGDGEPDGRFIDPCHQGQWDAFSGATPLQGTPAPTRLARLEMTVRDIDGEPRLWATGFDGPIGATRN